MNPLTKDVYLVIGGSGLLGRHIAERLRDRGDTVAVLDIVQRYDDIPFYHANICEEDTILDVLKRFPATCVFNTASPQATNTNNSSDIFWKVNVDGTNALISACVKAGVRKLIFTSSSGVIFNGEDVESADETTPYVEKQLHVYMETKVIAERALIAANGKNGLLTTILRPSGIFGPGDRQTIKSFYATYDTGRTGIQIGNNTNRMDWTYVTNVADAHILAADKLEASANPPVAGEIFFITNDDPWPFWDFPNGIYDRLDVAFPGKRVKKKPFVIPKTVAMLVASLAELIAWLTGKESPLNRFNVVFTCTSRWHRIDKAKKALGYTPRVSMDEGLDLTVAWWVEQIKSGGAS